MTLQYADRIQETTTTTGTSAYALAGAVVGYQPFSNACSNADTCYYTVTDGTNWEVGLGTYASSGNTLARTAIFASSNSGSAVSWASGTRNIWLDFPAYFLNTAAVLTGTLSVAGHVTLEGVTSTGATGIGNIVFSSSPTLTSPALGTPASGVLTHCTGLVLTSGVTGVLPIANGGTGQTTAPLAINALLPSQTGASGYTLTTNGLVASWGAGAGGGGTVTTTGSPSSGEIASFSGSTSITNSNLSGDVTTSNTLATTVAKIQGTTVSGTTGTTNVVFSSGPTLTAPVLGTPASGTLTNCTGLVLTSGVTGVLPIANGGTNASTASITAFNNITGYTAAGATGTTSTNLVFSTSPTLITPTLGVASATSINATATGTTSPYTIGGHNALWQDATNANLAVGYSAMPTTISQTGGGALGSAVIAIGQQALNANTTGYANIGIGAPINTIAGSAALYANTSGHDNIAIGSGALSANTTGAENVVVGMGSVLNNATGISNVVVGNDIMINTGSTAGSYNTIMGESALNQNSGSYNACFGYQAGYSNTTGSYLTAFGPYAAFYCDDITGASTTQNCAFGYGALFGNSGGVSGLGNAALGSGALSSLSTGNYNTATGIAALLALTTGSNNTAIGYQVGHATLTTGSNNILIGVDSTTTTSSSSTSNTFILKGVSGGAALFTATGMNTTPTLTIGAAASTFNGTLEANSIEVSSSSAPSGEGIYDLVANTMMGIAVNGAAAASIDLNGTPRFYSDSYVSSNVTWTSNTTLSAITGLSATLLAGKVYSFRIYLYATASAAGGYKGDLNGGSATATTLLYDGTYSSGAGAENFGIGQITSLSSSFISAATPTQSSLVINGFIKVANAGTLIPRFAQDVSNSTATTILVGSHMIVRQIG